MAPRKVVAGIWVRERSSLPGVAPKPTVTGSFSLSESLCGTGGLPGFVQVAVDFGYQRWSGGIDNDVSGAEGKVRTFDGAAADAAFAADGIGEEEGETEHFEIGLG